MKPIRHVLFLFLLPAITVQAAPADERAPRILLEDTATRQAQLKRAFETFRTRLAIMANRWENGSAEEKQKATSLRKALALITTQGTTARFDSVISGLTRKGADANLDVLGGLVRDNRELRQDLQKILALLLESDPGKGLKDRKDRIDKLLTRLKEARDQQARLLAQTERGRGEARALARAQDGVTQQTEKALEPTDTDKEKQEIEIVRKPVEEAIREQQKASKQLQGNSRSAASDSQEKAVGKLDEAIRRLEDLLRETRREERQQKLADLLARCKRMLQMQTGVRDDAEKLAADLGKGVKGKPTVAEASRSGKLADRQVDVVREAEAALKLVKAEDTAVVFAEVLGQIHDDMDTIQRRLDRIEVDQVTLKISNDVIESLKDVIKALEKNLAENDEDGPKTPPGDGPRRDPKLVNFLQQLKMILAMQRRINERTSLYSKSYEGEQVPARAKDEKERQHLTRIEKELRDLADRQERLSRATREVSKQPEAQAMRID